MIKRSQIEGFAVDIGGTKTAAAHIIAGEVVARVQMLTDTRNDMQSRCDPIENLLKQIGFEIGMPLVFAVTGRLDVAGHWYAVNQETFSEKPGSPLRTIFEDRFGPIQIVNDVVAASVGEARFGAGRGDRAFGYLTVSTGIGGNVITNGLPLKSCNGLAGHLGFVSSRYSDARCGSGRQGTVESIASGRAIARQAAVKGQKGLTAKEVFDYARAGEAWAIDIIDASASSIATLIGDLTSIFGLDRLAIGGSIGLAGNYIDRVKRFLLDERELFRVPVVAAELGQDSALLGALALLLDSDRITEMAER